MRDDDLSAYDTTFLRIAKSAGLARAARAGLLEELNAREAITRRAIEASVEVLSDVLIVLRLECPELVDSALYRRIEATRAEVAAVLGARL